MELVTRNKSTKQVKSPIKEILPLDTMKLCCECKEKKPLHQFNPTEANIGRRKAYCKQCEAGLINPKVPPKIVGKGRPIFGFGRMGEMKEQHNQIVSKVTGKIDIVQGKLVGGEEMEEKPLKIEEEAMKLYQNVIVPYVDAFGDGFKAKDIKKQMDEDEYSQQYIGGMFRRLVSMRKLKAKKRKGNLNTYYLVKAKEKKVKKAKIDFEKVEVIPETLPKNAEVKEGKIIFNEPNAEERKRFLEEMQQYKKKGEDKMKKQDKNKEDFNDDFLRGISTIADEVKINFVERTTEIIISPSGNLLRVYDLLSKTQKENAVVDGKNLKFTW